MVRSFAPKHLAIHQPLKNSLNFFHLFVDEHWERGVTAGRVCTRGLLGKRKERNHVYSTRWAGDGA